MFGSFPPSLWLVCASKVYSGLGADIVMESFHQQRRCDESELGGTDCGCFLARTRPASRRNSADVRSRVWESLFELVVLAHETPLADKRSVSPAQLWAAG